MPRKPEFVAAPVAAPVVVLGQYLTPTECGMTAASSIDPKKPRIDALPNVQYAEGTFEPGTHETPARIVEVPTATGPTLEALGERRAQLRANLGHARNSVKGADDSRAVAAENALRRFDESGDGIRLRLFCVTALKETARAQA